MKRIESIESNIKMIQPKLDINAKDWTKDEKTAIAESYFEITKVSTGKGRNLDIGCSSCIEGAVNIINNYLLLSANEEPSSADVWKDESPSPMEPSNKQWRKNQDSIDAAALELGVSFPEDITSKKDKIAALEAHIESLNIA